jgi:STIP1 family protein 1
MAGQDIPADPAKALECKEKGNKCFQAGDFVAAEALYSKAYVSYSHITLLSLSTQN